MRLEAIPAFAALLAGCADASAPAPLSLARVDDPVGDTFGSSAVRWDATALSVTRDKSAITVVLELANGAVSPGAGDADAMVGIVDFDVDQNAATGRRSTVDDCRPGAGSTALGADYQLALMNYAADGSVAVADVYGVPTGRVTPRFDGSRVTIRIPLELLGGDDGRLDAAAIVGTKTQATDILPEDGHLSLSR